MIPKAENNFTFELRESCRQIDDRKWCSIKSIQCYLRSSIFGALTRSNVKLFSAFGMRSYQSTLYLRLSLPLLALLFPVNFRLEALPSISDVAHGKVNIVASGNELLVEATDRTVLNYDHFDIQSCETVRFQMADSAHRVLNRVCSDMPSHIDGKLLSNGIVYLLNPAGILFGPDSVVNVASLYAATAHLSDQDFIRGIDRFNDIQGRIEIYGTISAQEVALIGKSIFQKGNILAEEGQLLFVTAEHVYLGKEESHLFVKCDRQDLQDVQEKPCFLESGAPAAFVLHHTGVSKAKKIHLYAEDDSLVKVSGNLDASQIANSSKGGKVRIQGEVISLEGVAIEASGTLGGGEVLIGGGKHGEGLYPTAQYTVCDEQTSIHTDAISRGDGGEITLWADKATIFDAKLFSRGGAIEGNGGYIETSSGDRFRAITGFVDVSATQGQAGRWDLDPCSVTIIKTGTNSPTNLSCTSTSGSPVPELNDGCECGGGSCETDPITMMLVTDYVVTESCLNTFPAGTILIATASTIDNTYISLGNNQGASPANITINTAGVNVSFSSSNNVGHGTIYLNGSFQTTGGLTFLGKILVTGDTVLTSQNGSVVFGTAVYNNPIDASSSTPPNFSVNAAGPITFYGPIGQSSTLNTFNATTSGNNAIGFHGGGAYTQGDILIQSTSSPAANSIALFAPATFSSAHGNITFNGELTSDSTSTPRDLTLSAGGDITFGNFVGINPIGDLTIIDANNVELLSQPNAALPTITMRARSFTQLAGRGETHFEGTLFTYGSPVPQLGGTPPTPPANGGDVNITTDGDINFYYLVQHTSGGNLFPVLVPAPTDIVVYKSVITTTGGRQSSSSPTVNNPNAPNGLRGGSVTLHASSINLLAVYAGGTPAFPGTSGTGGAGGNIDITSINGTALRGPLIATGGAGVGGGAENLPTLIFANQNLSAKGVGSPGDISITGPLTLGFNGIIMRGGDINIGAVQSEPSNLLGIDSSTAANVQLGSLSNLSYFVVDYAKGVVVTSPVQASGVDLYNAGSNNIVFQQPVTSTDIQQIANDFCVIYEQGFTTTTKTFLNCGCSPTPPPPTPATSPVKKRRHGRGFAAVWAPSFDVFYYAGDIFYSNDDSFLYIPQDVFFLDYVIPPKITDKLK